MARFGRLVSQVDIPKMYCDVACKKCSSGRCTKNLGHTENAGHRSTGKQSDGKAGCGHSWGGL